MSDGETLPTGENQAPLDAEALAKVLREARATHGISQADLAKALGVSTRTVARWESGQSSAGARKVAAIASTAMKGKNSPLALLGLVGAAALGPGIAALAAAGAAAGVLHLFGDANERSKEVVTNALRAAAEDLDVSARKFRAALRTVLMQADDEGLTVGQLVALIGDSGRSAPSVVPPPISAADPHST